MRNPAHVARPLLAVLVVFAMYASMFAPSVSAESRVTTFTTFETDEPYIALTFDVTFERGDAVQILDTLRARNVPATFAIVGVWARDNPDLVRRMVDEGHHLINHTWDHPSLTGEYTGSTIHQPRPGLTRSQIISQLQRTEDIVRQQVGVELGPYVRPPYGDHNDFVLSAMADAGYVYNIMWTVDTLGWYGHPVNTVRQRAVNAARPGANILMHVGHGATDAAALPGIIDDLTAMEYQFATVEDFVEGELSQPAEIHFPQTGEDLSGNFLRYWQRFGGLPIFGYPVSPEIEIEGMTVQYFERARFELQPGTWPERFDVHLTRLGAELVDDRGDETPFRRVEGESDQSCTFFEPTGHTLCHGFRDYWEQFGGLAIYGYPISEEFLEVNPDTGETYVVQYFERQRFEWHPGVWPERHDVLLGRVGAQAYRNSASNWLLNEAYALQ